MTKYYYVKSGGTATGDTYFSTKKTGEWSTALSSTSDYYDNLGDCFYEGYFSPGDTVFVSSDHYHTYSLSGPLVLDSYDPIYVVSVDDYEIETPYAGATEEFNNETTAYIATLNIRYCYGVYFYPTGRVSLTVDTGSSDESYKNVYDKCHFRLPSDSSYDSHILYIHAAELSNKGGGPLLFRNCRFDCNYNGSSGTYRGYIYLNQGSVEFIECEFLESIIGSSRALIHGMAESTAAYTYHDVKFLGCNFSNFYRPLINSSLSIGSPTISFLFDRCSFNPTYNGSFSHFSGFLESFPFAKVFLSGNYTGGNDIDIYQFLSYPFGTVTESLSIYRTSGATLDGTTGYSFKVETTSFSEDIPHTQHFKIRLNTVEADSTDTENPVTFTIHFAQNNSATSLKNDEIWAEAAYSRTGAYVPQALRSTSFVSIASLTSPSDLPSSSASWEGLTTPTKQKLEITTSTDTGGWDGIHTIDLYIAKPGVTIYVCPKVDVA
jgi:hypothetical protein